MPESLQKQSIRLKAKLFRGFSDPSRLLILEALRQGPLTVTQIVNATCLNQPNVSNHLGCLRECDLVKVDQQGRFAYYRLNGETVGQLLSLADRLLGEVAQGIMECARYTLPEEANDPPAND